MILDINFRLRSYVLKLNLPNYYMIERSNMRYGRNVEPGKQGSAAMESKEPRQINEFKVMDEHGNDYTVVEYQDVTETRSLKWRKAGSSWFGLVDGTPVGKIDDATFRIETSDTVIRRHTA
jgi:hypothetical protein